MTTSPDRPIVLTATDRDRARWLTWLAVAMTLTAGALRIVGLPPIDLHGPLHRLGIMDPLCGGTRAMYLLTANDLAGAARFNPTVFPLAFAVVAALVRAGVGWSTGRWASIRVSPTVRRTLPVVVLALVIALEARQQLRADLLMQAWPSSN